jgi:hypothetical protein
MQGILPLTLGQGPIIDIHTREGSSDTSSVGIGISIPPALSRFPGSRITILREDSVSSGAGAKNVKPIGVVEPPRMAPILGENHFIEKQGSVLDLISENPDRLAGVFGEWDHCSSS